jgi:hypothetical protein
MKLSDAIELQSGGPGSGRHKELLALHDKIMHHHVRVGSGIIRESDWKDYHNKLYALNDKLSSVVAKNCDKNCALDNNHSVKEQLKSTRASIQKSEAKDGDQIAADDALTGMHDIIRHLSDAHKQLKAASLWHSSWWSR